MNKPRLMEFFASVYITWSLLFIALVGMPGAAHADEPEETIPVNLSVNIHWDIDEGYNIRKGHFRMNAKTTLTLDRPGSALDQNPKLTPFSLKYNGETFTGSIHFEETLTEKKPQPPHCPPLLESYSGSRCFAYSPPKESGEINTLLLRRWGIAKSRLKSEVSGVGAQQFLAQLQSQMGIPSSYYEFFGGSISGEHTIYGKKRVMVNGQCRYEKAETKVSMGKIGLRFPIPEQGPMQGKKTWPVKRDTLPRNFAISLSQTGVGSEKPFRPEKAGSGGNATYSISWNFDEASYEYETVPVPEEKPCEVLRKWVKNLKSIKALYENEKIRDFSKEHYGEGNWGAYQKALENLFTQILNDPTLQSTQDIDAWVDNLDLQDVSGAFTSEQPYEGADGSGLFFEDDEFVCQQPPPGSENTGASAASMMEANRNGHSIDTTLNGDNVPIETYDESWGARTQTKYYTKAYHKWLEAYGEKAGHALFMAALKHERVHMRQFKDDKGRFTLDKGRRWEQEAYQKQIDVLEQFMYNLNC